MTTFSQAWDVLNLAHEAWSQADLALLRDCFTRDIEYQCNGGVADGKPLTLIGRDEFVDFWTPLVSEMENRTTPETLHLNGNVGRVQISAKVRHRPTGHILTGTYRQIVTFRSGLICRIEEYHDAAKLNAFWNLILNDDAIGTTLLESD